MTQHSTEFGPDGEGERDEFDDDHAQGAGVAAPNGNEDHRYVTRSGAVSVGFVGIPNSGKTSFIHAIRHNALAKGRGHGRWDFGLPAANAGEAFEDLEGSLQPGTTRGHFKVADFCTVRRAMLRIGSFAVGPKRMLVMPEVSGETLEEIAKGTEAMRRESGAERYLSFLSQSDHLICFASLDGESSSASGVVALNPARELANQLDVIVKVLQAADALRDRRSRCAVSVLITKADMLREREEFDWVVMPRDRSAVGKLAREPRRSELEQELQGQGSDESQVRFSTFHLMRCPCAEGDIDLQEAIAADFLRYHAPKAAEIMASLQKDQSARRSVRFFLAAPYGRSFTDEEGRQRKPEASELDPVMLFEPLESMLERRWLMHRKDRIRGRVLKCAALLALTLLLGPILTGGVMNWVRSGIREAADKPAERAARIEDTDLRCKILMWCPQVMLIQRSETFRSWQPVTAASVAEIYRLVANELQHGDVVAKQEAEVLRNAAAALRPDKSDYAFWANQVWQSLDGTSTAPATIDPSVLKLLSIDLEKRYADWKVFESKGRLQKLEAKISADDSPEAAELMQRIRRVRQREEARAEVDPEALLVANEDGSAYQPARSRLAELDQQRWAKARDAATAAVFKNPSDLRAWGTNWKSGSWESVAQTRLASERLMQWSHNQAEELRRDIELLGQANPAEAGSERLDAVQEWVKHFLYETDRASLPSWYTGWPIDLTEANASLEEIRQGFDLLNRVRSSPANVVEEQSALLDRCIKRQLPGKVFRLQQVQPEVPLDPLWAALNAMTRRELIQQVANMAVAKPDVVRKLQLRFPGDAEIGQIEEMARLFEAVNQKCIAGAEWVDVLDALDRVWDQNLKKQPQMKSQACAFLNDALLKNGDAVKRIADMESGQAARLKEIVGKMGCAQAFSEQYRAKAMPFARTLAKNRDLAQLDRVLSRCMEFEAGQGLASWRLQFKDLLASIRFRLERASDRDQLGDAELEADVCVLEQLGKLQAKWPLESSPSAVAAAVRKHIELIKQFDLVKVKAPRPNAPDIWLGRHEWTWEQAVSWKVVKAAGHEKPKLWPDTYFGPNAAVVESLVEAGLRQYGLRLPTLEELDAAHARRKVPMTQKPEKIDQEPESFRQPKTLDALDKTDEGLVGLFLGVEEICQEGLVFEGKPNFKLTFGVRVALDLIPNELQKQ
jgi:hypothetical protein